MGYLKRFARTGAKIVGFDPSVRDLVLYLARDFRDASNPAAFLEFVDGAFGDVPKKFFYNSIQSLDTYSHQSYDHRFVKCRGLSFKDVKIDNVFSLSAFGYDYECSSREELREIIRGIMKEKREDLLSKGACEFFVSNSDFGKGKFEIVDLEEGAELCKFVSALNFVRQDFGYYFLKEVDIERCRGADVQLETQVNPLYNSGDIVVKVRLKGPSLAMKSDIAKAVVGIPPHALKEYIEDARLSLTQIAVFEGEYEVVGVSSRPNFMKNGLSVFDPTHS
ncbi:MAG: hypothetical protein AAF560_10730 [Acidobacteriota bacterium]